MNGLFIFSLRTFGKSKHCMKLNEQAILYAKKENLDYEARKIQKKLKILI